MSANKLIEKLVKPSSISNTAVELLSVPFIAVLQSQLIDSKIFFEKKKKENCCCIFFSNFVGYMIENFGRTFLLFNVKDDIV